MNRAVWQKVSKYVSRNKLMKRGLSPQYEFNYLERLSVDMRNGRAHKR